MLRRGSTGDDVKELQEGLALLGLDPGPIDGIFGPKTEDAVKELQRTSDLDDDGIVGPNTEQAFHFRKGAAKAAQAAEADTDAAADDGDGAGTSPM